MADINVTERSFPFATGQGENVTEDDWSAMAGQWQDNGVAFGLTVVPGPTQNTIQLNEGQAAIDGFVYRLTAPKILPTLSNPDTVNRLDLVVLRLDQANEQIIPVVRSNTALSAVAANEVPLYSWTQLPASSATGTNWGSASDVRWYQGVRMRPATAGAFPPPTIGGFLYVPAQGGLGSVYIGALGTGGVPQWTVWAPGTDAVNALISAAVTPVQTQVTGLQTTVGQRVSTAGGSIITIANGNTTTKALQVRIPAGDRTTLGAVNTMEFQFNTGTDATPTWTTTSYFNEFGEFRVQSSATTRTPFRIKANVGQSAPLFDVKDSANVNTLMAVAADGTITAPNVGGARIYSGSTAPSSPKTGDVWVQF